MTSFYFENTLKSLRLPVVMWSLGGSMGVTNMDSSARRADESMMARDMGTNNRTYTRTTGHSEIICWA